MNINQRELRGQQITEKDNQIKRITEFEYEVKSQNSDKTYDIISTKFGWTCSCPDHQFRGTECKHIHSVIISQSIRKEVKKQVIINEVSVNNCQFCDSVNFVKCGIRHNKNHDLHLQV